MARLEALERVMDDSRLRQARAMGISLGVPRMSPEECVNRSYPHNARCRWTDGFYCEDCGAWVPEDDDNWYFTDTFGNRQERPPMKWNTEGKVPPAKQ